MTDADMLNSLVRTAESAAPVPPASNIPSLSISPSSVIVPPTQAALLLQFLQVSDATCPTCKYNCRGLTAPRCPECGRELTLALGAAEPYVLPWTLMVVFVAMAASIGVLVGGLVGRNGSQLIHFLVRSRDIPHLLAVAYGLVAVPLLFVLVAWRRRFFQLKPREQWILAAAALAINVFLAALSLLSH